MRDLGINNSGVDLEVALEVLGEKRQKIMRMMYAERNSDAPSSSMLKFCTAMLAAIDDFQDNLRPEEVGAISKILDKSNFPIQ